MNNEEPPHDPAAQDSVTKIDSTSIETESTETMRVETTHIETPAGAPATHAEAEPAAVGMELLYDVELEATLQFGSRELPLREVLELGPGDVIELDRHVSEPVDLVVGDRIVARGEVVVASGNFALRITEVATPQLRLESIRCLF